MKKKENNIFDVAYFFDYNKDEKLFKVYEVINDNYRLIGSINDDEKDEIMDLFKNRDNYLKIEQILNERAKQSNIN